MRRRTSPSYRLTAAQIRVGAALVTLASLCRGVRACPGVSAPTAGPGGGGAKGTAGWRSGAPLLRRCARGLSGGMVPLDGREGDGGWDRAFASLQFSPFPLSHCPHVPLGG